MRKELYWVWTLLFWLYLLTVLSNTAVFFNPESQTKIYYQTLVSFHAVFLIPYLLNWLSIILDICAIVPFYNFLNPVKHRIGKNSISPNTWKWFFGIRFALIFVGHNFESKELQSMTQNDFWLTLTVITSMALIEGPSHVAVFFYAYQQQYKSQTSLK